MKVTQKSLNNFRMATGMVVNGKQYKVVEEASEDVLKKISSKINKQRNK